MTLWRRFLLRLLNVFRSGRAEHELSRELASHVALIEEEYRRRGMTPGDAALAARRAIGGVDQAKELHRDARSLPWLEDARRDVPYALRSLARNPGFTAVAILTLALGIGANTAIFTVVHAVLLRPLPFADADGLVEIVEHIPPLVDMSAPPRRAPAMELGTLEAFHALAIRFMW